nr:reverse transcriptase domain-containing protein [Tanacetum cinerariifolium]
MKALTIRIDSQFKEIKGEMKEMRDRCNKCGRPHPSLDYDDKPMGGPKEEEEIYASREYRGGYRGNYYGRNSSNWRDHVIDEITKDELDALLDDSKPFLNTPEKISVTPLYKEFDEFMSGNAQEDKVKDDFKELPPKDELRIRTSI